MWSNPFIPIHPNTTLYTVATLVLGWDPKRHPSSSDMGTPPMDFGPAAVAPFGRRGLLARLGDNLKHRAGRGKRKEDGRGVGGKGRGERFRESDPFGFLKLGAGGERFCSPIFGVKVGGNLCSRARFGPKSARKQV